MEGGVGENPSLSVRSRPTLTCKGVIGVKDDSPLPAPSSTKRGSGGFPGPGPQGVKSPHPGEVLWGSGVHAA